MVFFLPTPPSSLQPAVVLSLRLVDVSHTNLTSAMHGGGYLHDKGGIKATFSHHDTMYVVADQIMWCGGGVVHIGAESE